MGQLEIVYEDREQNALYFNNGEVTDIARTKVIAELRNTNTRGIYDIIGKRSGQVIGEFISGRGPRYFSTESHSASRASSSIDTVHRSSGSADDLDIHSGNEETYEVETVKRVDDKMPELVEYDALPGYEFRPMPVTYCDVKDVEVYKNVYKWKVELKKNDDEGLVMNSDNHSKIYDMLEEESRINEAKLTLMEEVYQSVAGKVSYTDVYLGLRLSSSDIALATLESSVGHCISIQKDSNNSKPLSYMGEDKKTGYINLLSELTEMNTIKDWITALARRSTPAAIESMRDYLLALLRDNLETVSGAVTLEDNINLVNVLSEVEEALDTIEDLELRAKYKSGLRNILKSLTDMRNIESFISYDNIKEDSHVMTCIGLTETYPLMITDNKYIVTEFKQLLSDRTDDYLVITEHVPNLFKYSKAIFSDKLIDEEDNRIVLDNHMGVPNNKFFIVIEGSLFKILNIHDKYLIRVM